MKRISTQKNSFLKRLIINIPFVLIVALMAVCFLGGAVLFIYSVVTAVAFHSAMISLLLVGAGLILIGCGVALISAFKKYYAFYDLKMGWVYPDRPSPAEKAPAKDATSTSFKKPLKAYFSLSTISIVALAIGSLFTIISAALGCVDRANWVAAIGSYKEDRGYYSDVRHLVPQYFVEDIATHDSTLSTVDISLLSKQAVIIYFDLDDPEHEQGYVYVNAYSSYENQIVFSISADKSTLKIVESPAPDYERTAIDKMLFFVGDILRSVPGERQISIYIPSNFKDDVSIVCDPQDALIFAHRE